MDEPTANKTLTTFEAAQALAFGSFALAGLSLVMIGSVYVRVGVAWALFWCAFILVMHREAIWSSIKRRRIAKELWIPFFVLISVCVLYVAVIGRDFVLHEYNQFFGPQVSEVRLLSQRYPDKLGAAINTRPVPIETYAVESVHEHAIVIWIKDLNRAYYLPSDEPPYFARRVQIVADAAEGENLQWHDRSWLNSKFKECLTSGESAPEGGVARRWLYDPKHYSWVGCQQYKTTYLAGELYYQIFSNGIILGPLRTGQQYEQASFYVLLNSGDIYRQPTPLSPAPFRSR